MTQSGSLVTLLSIFVPLLEHTVILLVSVVPFFSPVLHDRVVLVVDLAPVLSLPEAVGLVNLPFIAPLLFVSNSMDFSPFFVPFLLGLKVLAPLLAI